MKIDGVGRGYEKLNGLRMEAMYGVCREDVMGRKHNGRAEKGLGVNIAGL